MLRNTGDANTTPEVWWSMTCLCCGKAFRSTTRHEGYCSDECRQSARRARARIRGTVTGDKNRIGARTCAFCATKFVPTRNVQRYCSAACRVSAHRAALHGSVDQTVARYCTVCGCAFFANSNAQKYCSPECRQSARAHPGGNSTTTNGARASVHESVHGVHAHGRSPMNTRVSRVCARCGKGFTARRSDAHFCSVACRVSAHRAHQRTTNGHPELAIRVCKVCARLLPERAARATKYCSPECAHTARIHRARARSKPFTTNGMGHK